MINKYHHKKTECNNDDNSCTVGDNELDFDSNENFKQESEKDVICQSKSAELTFEIGGDSLEKINKISKKSYYAMYAILLSALSFIIYKHTHNQDIIIGFPMKKQENERDALYELLPIRCKVNTENNFKTYLTLLGQDIRNAFINQCAWIDDATETSSLNRIALYLGDGAEEEIYSNIKAGMLVSFIIKDTNMLGHIRYNSQLFEKDTIERISRQIIKYLEEVLRNPDIKLYDVNILHELEAYKILHDFNNTKTDYPKNKTIHELFEEQVGKNADATALIFGDKTLTYKELNDKSNQLASLLISKGVKPDSIVGIMIERSFEMMIGILGILKAGGAYLPIDIQYPLERIKYILEDSNASILLVNKTFENNIGFCGEIIKLDSEKFCKRETKNANGIVSSSNLAYIIYTSGSTGKPKGVMIEHHSVVNRLKWMQKKYSISKNDVILQKTPYTFDVSVWELFWWGFEGASLCLLEPGGEKDPKKIIDTIEKNNVGIIHFVPSMLNMFLIHIDRQDNIEKLKSLKQVFASGEALTLQQVNKFNNMLNKQNGTLLANLYGPTEATVDVSYFDCSEGIQLESIPIGKPIDNIELYIIDKDNNLQPIGIDGELCISGVGLARGYLNNHQLTSEKFIPNPFRPEDKMYKTGDLAKWLPDGNIEFLGRIDNQVKIRGFRIELGEIENQLMAYNGIEQAVVLSKVVGTENNLYAYFTSCFSVNIKDIKEYLAKHLPSYMMPSFYIQLNEIPINPSGKTDRKKLLNIEIDMYERKDYKAPGTETEKKLEVIWEKLLNRKKISIEDDFISLGGHSLKAIDLVLEIQDVFNVKVPVGMVFSLSNIRNIANYIEKTERTGFEEIVEVESKEYYAISPAQNRMFILNRFDMESTAYNLPFLWTIKGVLDIDRLKKAILDLIKRHEALRTSFHIINGAVVQKIHEKVDFDFDIIHANMNNISSIFKDFVKPFDLGQAPLFRVKLIKNNENEFTLLIDIHHIVSDAVSLEILCSELAEFYTGKARTKLKVQYKEYANWLNSITCMKHIESQEKYWLSAFNGILPALNLPLDYERKQVYSTKGEQIFFEIKGELFFQLRKFSIENNLTIFTILFAAYVILLSKYTGQDDIVVGIPVAGRGHKNLKNVMGVFVNTLAIRSYPSTKKTIYHFINELNDNLLIAYENQDYPFENLVDKISFYREYGRNPIFDTMFNLLGKPEIRIEGLEFTKQRIGSINSLFDIELDGEIGNNEIEFYLNYNTSLFKQATMNKFAQWYINVIEKVINYKDLEISDIELLVDTVSTANLAKHS